MLQLLLISGSDTRSDRGNYVTLHNVLHPKTVQSAGFPWIYVDLLLMTSIYLFSCLN